jgi:hypothetical protein
MIRAYCFPSGLIEFGNTIPRGAIIIARGQAETLRDFIEVKARHGYRTREIRGRPTKIRGSHMLLVPGVPEADNQIAAADALERWLKWIAIGAPKGVRVTIPAGSSSSRAPTFPVGDAVSTPSPAPPSRAVPR